MRSLEQRVISLERTNRLLVGACACFALLLVYGFQNEGPSDLIRTKRLEVMDDKGVPVVTLAPSRSGGGELVIRDESGDRRAWLTSGKGAARLGMLSGTEDSPTSSVGFGVEPNHARLALAGSKATASVAVDVEAQSVELSAPDGHVLFSAPYRKHS